MHFLPKGDTAGTLQRTQSGSVDGRGNQTSNGALAVCKPGEWTISDAPAAATQATKTKAAAAGSRHVCTGIIATIATDATAQTPLTVYLRDGATGVGTVLLALTVSAPANGMGGIALDGLNVVGSVNTAMTVEFSGVGVASSKQAVNLMGHTAS